ncbi:Uu.00g038080.m01.CDS01 [Anthostomella pinea]|uniref:Uu.00g038080.m01.CDS01 n=1 Tax=Anthostomella pinea TaxID=933095 RepID=A0AAI8YDP5_9PEZI|nr:Uu.00g038080.m01.CDS01 [Anthostomella pinea]
MSSTAPANFSCGRCHTSQQDLDEPLKHCAACQSVQYCSRDCQRRDWQDHKTRCRQIQAGAAPQGGRTTMAELGRKTGQHDAGSANDQAGTNTIYYLKTSTPHLYDITLSGPYRDLDAVYPQIMNNFGSEYPAGRSAVQDFMRDGHLMSFQHITAPHRNDPNRTRTMRLVTERASRSYLDPMEILNITDYGGGVSLTDIHVRGTYDNEAAANTAAERVVQQLIGQLQGGNAYPGPGSDFAAMISGSRADGSEALTMVEVRHDTGYPRQ